MNRQCVICTNIMFAEDHNADPIAEGRCCEDCNFRFVIPARLTNKCPVCQKELGKTVEEKIEQNYWQQVSAEKHGNKLVLKGLKKTEKELRKLKGDD